MKLLPEWAPQDAIQLAWPHSHSDWQPWLNQAETLYAQLVREVSQYQHVIIACDPSIDLSRLEQLLKDAGTDPHKVHLYQVPTNDTWARDHGPIGVENNNEPVLLDFIFNGWGDKFESVKDNRINTELAALNSYAAPLVNRSLVLEGGSLDTDGQGTLLTTAECLLNPNRNPSLSKHQIEQQLSEIFDLQQIIWLTEGHLEGDDTDAHIDTLARFCNEKTIAYVSCDDENDSHYQALKAMEHQLTQACDINGSPYQLVALPWPKARYNSDGRRLPLTYANFLITNQQVLVPIYGDVADSLALERLQNVFGDREVVGLDCSVLVEQFGSLHCITMQLPKGAVKGTVTE
jgi:agmatine/peptidylarginine deiminase